MIKTTISLLLLLIYTGCAGTVYALNHQQKEIGDFVSKHHNLA